MEVTGNNDLPNLSCFHDILKRHEELVCRQELLLDRLTMTADHRPPAIKQAKGPSISAAGSGSTQIEDDLPSSSLSSKSTSLPDEPDDNYLRVRSLMPKLRDMSRATNVYLAKDDRKGRTAFPDKEDIKKRLTERMTARYTEQLLLYDLYGDDLLGRVAKSSWFESVSLLMVSLNAIWLPINMDLNQGTSIHDTLWVFIVFENLFCFFFTSELLIRFWALRSKRSFFRDSYLMLDAFVMVFMVFETWVVPLMQLMRPDQSFDGVYGHAGAFRILRFLRLVRTFRMAKLLRKTPELLYLIHGLIAGMRSVVYALLLLLGFLYVFGMAFRALSEDTAFGALYFPSVPETVLSLFQHAALLDSFGIVVQAIRAESVICTILFFVVVCVTCLTLLNMVIGVLCEVVTSVSSAEREAADDLHLRQVLENVFKHLDLADNGKIDKQEFLKGIETNEFVDALHDLDIDLVALLDMADVLFQSDECGSIFTEEIEFDKFFRVVAQLRGDNGAKVRDIAHLRLLVHQDMTTRRDEMTSLMKALKNIKMDTKHLLHQIQPGLAENQSKIEAVPSGPSARASKKTVAV